MRPRVLYISHECRKGIGGSTYSLYQLIKSVENDIDPIVVSNPGDAINFLKENGIPCMEIKLPIRLQVWYAKKSRYKIIERLVKIVYNYSINAITALYLAHKFKNKIDIIHTNSAVLDIGFKVAKLLKVQHIWHLREFLDLDHDMYPLLGWKHIYKLCQKGYTISISKKIASHYKLSSNTVIYDAIADYSNIQQPITPSQRYFLYAGGKKIQKGILDAIRVFKQFSVNHPEYQLLLTGNYQDITEYDLTQIIGNNPNIKILGYRKDLQDLMRQATAFLMCSHNEGLGRVTVEAIFAGCPVIGYAGGATTEIIQNKKTGWLYKTDAEFLNCLEEVIQNPQEVLQRITKAQLFVTNNFTNEVYRKKILKLYNKLCTQ